MHTQSIVRLVTRPRAMSKHARGSADPKLAYMIHDWQRTTGGTSATEDDAEAIVAWLRSRKGSEYARKPADGLRTVSYTHLTLPTICSV